MFKNLWRRPDTKLLPMDEAEYWLRLKARKEALESMEQTKMKIQTYGGL